MPQVSGIVFVIVSVFVIVIVFLFIRSCPLITLIKYLKSHKSLGSLSEGVLKMYLSLSLSLCLSLPFFWSGHVSSSLGSNVSKVTGLLDCSLKLFSKCICLCNCLCLCICLCHCLFFGQVMSPHHSDQMSQRSQVSRVTL